MDLRIKTTDFVMNQEVTAYLDDKISAIEKLLADEADNARCEVTLGKGEGHAQHGDVWMAEIIVMNEGERSIASATGESINAAIDIAKDEILQQLRKQKGRNSTMTRRMGAKLKKLARWG